MNKSATSYNQRCQRWKYGKSGSGSFSFERQPLLEKAVLYGTAKRCMELLGNLSGVLEDFTQTELLKKIKGSPPLSCDSLWHYHEASQKGSFWVMGMRWAPKAADPYRAEVCHYHMQWRGLPRRTLEPKHKTSSFSLTLPSVLCCQSWVAVC